MLEVRNVSLNWEHKVLQYNHQFAEQKMHAIVGKSGVGKTTLLHVISGLFLKHKGDVFWQNVNITKLSPSKRPISLLFQENNLFNHLNIKDNLNIGFAKKEQAGDELLMDILTRFKLGDIRNRYPKTLSGGEQQRVALARVWLRNKPILLLDEPFSALDKELRSELMVQLKELHERKKLTTLIVSHHLDEIKEFVDTVTTIEHKKMP